MQDQNDESIPETNSDQTWWKALFIILLVVNLLYLGNGFLSDSDNGMFSPLFDQVELLVFLAIIDLPAVLAYIITQHPHGGPHGIARVISDAVLIAAIFALMFAGVLIYMIFHLVFHSY